MRVAGGEHVRRWDTRAVFWQASICSQLRLPGRVTCNMQHAVRNTQSGTGNMQLVNDDRWQMTDYGRGPMKRRWVTQPPRQGRPCPDVTIRIRPSRLSSLAFFCNPCRLITPFQPPPRTPRVAAAERSLYVHLV